MGWPCFKVFWLSKDNPSGHNERKMKKEADRRRGGKTISKSGLLVSAKKLLISRLFIGHHTAVWCPLVSISNHEGSTFTEKDRNKLTYRIGPKRT